MRATLIAFGLLTALLLGGCSSTPIAGDGHPLPVETLSKGLHSGIDAPRLSVVRDGEAWQALWQAHHAMRQPAPPLPEIDFTRDMVIVAFMGQRPSGGYHITVSEVMEHRGAVLVRMVSRTPPSDGIATQALTQPFHLVRVPRLDQRVVFSLIEE